MSLYIRLYTDFWTHKKTMKLKTIIGDDAFWIPPRLWSYAADHQVDGDFSSYSSEVLCEILGCSKHAPSMLQALHSSGFMVDNKLNDWESHNEFHAKNSIRAKKAAKSRWLKEESTKEEKNKEERESEQALLKHSSSMLQASSEPKTYSNHLALSDSPMIQKGFRPPSLAEIEHEMFLLQVPEAQRKSEAKKFFDYYDSIDWVRGKSQIKNWKPVCDTWVSNMNKTKSNGSFSKPSKPIVKRYLPESELPKL